MKPAPLSYTFDGDLAEDVYFYRCRNEVPSRPQLVPSLQPPHCTIASLADNGALAREATCAEGKELRQMRFQPVRMTRVQYAPEQAHEMVRSQGYRPP